MSEINRDRRLKTPGPKRILCIDAAGGRGMLAAALLGGLEARLRRLARDPDLRLWDYFDLIGGASSSALLAAALAAGASVEEACGLYEDAGPAPDAPPKGDPVRRAKFDAARLEAMLPEAFGDAQLCDPRIQTGVAVLVKPLESEAPVWWTNAPGGLGAERGFAEAVRASAGGDTAFDAAHGYADAALAGGANPSLSLLRFALDPKGLGWAAGPDKLLFISLGAGRLRPPLERRVFDARPDPNPAATAAGIATRAAYALETALFEAGEEALSALKQLAAPREGAKGHEPPMAFRRLDMELTPGVLASLGLTEAEIAAVIERTPLTAAKLDLLKRVGLAAGERAFEPPEGVRALEHVRALLPRGFDPLAFRNRGGGPNRLTTLASVFGGGR